MTRNDDIWNDQMRINSKKLWQLKITNEWKKGRDLFLTTIFSYLFSCLVKRGYLFQKNGNSDVDITMFAI